MQSPAASPRQPKPGRRWTALIARAMVALVPDSLLAQLLMVSTCPADFQAAVSWTQAHRDDKGGAAIAKVDSQPWDPSVKSLTALPQVLALRGSKPEGVQRLGDAYLAKPGPGHHGYRCRIPKGQGSAAPGGARSDLIGPRMVSGFALVAWPVRYGTTGVTSFIVRQSGRVCERDLGPDSTAAAAIQRFNPDAGWKPARP